MDNKEAAGSGCGLGSIIALILSAALNHSFWWAILHGLFGWLYVIYVLAARSHEIIPAFRNFF